MSEVLEYDKTGQASRVELFQQHSELVKRLAYHLHNRLPKNIVIDDLIQTGMIGLNEAIRTFDPSKGASFTTYATLKIRGAMIDELRSLEWVPRSVQDNSRKISGAIRSVENRLGKEATSQQIADELGVDLNTYYTMLKDVNCGKILDLYDPSVESEANLIDKSTHSPQQEVTKNQIKKYLAEQISLLPEKEQQMLALYYFEELNFKEIGKVLQVSESRICQIHSQALTRLKSRFDQL